MPEIKQYTRQVLPQQTNNVRADASSFGGDVTGQMMQARALEQLGNSFNETSKTAGDVALRIRTREDTVNRIRASDKFYNETFDEFTRAQTEMDLTDPQVAKDFNKKIREKAQGYLNSYSGSPDGRVRLEAQITDIHSQFTRQMNSNSLQAQRKFIMTKAGEQINQLAQRAATNPELLGSIFQEADAVVQDISPSIYAEDEIDLISAAQEQITLSALRSYTDAGRYEEARGLINENPTFMTALSPNSQREILSNIQSGIEARDKEVNDMRRKITAVRSAATELGIDVNGAAVFSAVTGIEEAQTPEAKITEFARIVNKNPDELTPSVIAKIGFGVDLPSSGEVDFNKDYTPDGQLTPRGIGAQIKQPFEAAATAKTLHDKVSGAIALFRNDGNKQALLSAMISFQKALDDGAIVREGDIALQREAQGISDKISLWAKPGQVIGGDLIDEMEATMNDFTSKALESAKVQIDPYVKDAEQRGYRPIDYGLPREAYSRIFANVKTPEGGGDGNKDRSTITADEFLKQ